MREGVKWRVIETRHGRFGEYEPGNGTRYTAMAIRVVGKVSFGSLGSVTNGWLVVNGFNGKAYLFQASQVQPLADEYIQEKLGGLEGDYPYFGDLVRKLLGRPNIEVVE